MAAGVCPRFLSEQLAKIVDPSGEAAVLATQRLANVRFCRQQGFGVTREKTLCNRRTRFLNWIMRRPPATPIEA